MLEIKSNVKYVKDKKTLDQLRPELAEGELAFGNIENGINIAGNFGSGVQLLLNNSENNVKEIIEEIIQTEIINTLKNRSIASPSSITHVILCIHSSLGLTQNLKTLSL